MPFENFRRCLNAFTRRRPFVPFLLQFEQGETLLIVHPEAIRAHNEVIRLVEPNNRSRLFDAESVCQLLERPAGTEGAAS